MLIKDDSLKLSPSPAACPYCRSGFFLPLSRRWWQRLQGSRRRLRCQGCGAVLKINKQLR